MCESLCVKESTVGEGDQPVCGAQSGASGTLADHGVVVYRGGVLAAASSVHLSRHFKAGRDERAGRLFAHRRRRLARALGRAALLALALRAGVEVVDESLLRRAGDAGRRERRQHRRRLHRPVLGPGDHHGEGAVLLHHVAAVAHGARLQLATARF